MSKIGEKYLPIGTVVMLKGASKRVMVTGFCAIKEKNKNEIWDYIGCMYPEGILSLKQTILFNHEQIDKIYYIGLIDEEEENFKEDLKKMITETQEQNNNV